MSKICTRCKKVKIEEEFHISKQHKDGLQSWCKSCSKAAWNLWRKNNKERAYKNSRNWIVKNREKDRAYQAVKRALKKGLIKKDSCADCGSYKVEAHHEDYTKPLDVIWLCSRHHKDTHYDKLNITVLAKSKVL